MLQHQYATMGGEKRGDGKHRSYYTYALSGGSKVGRPPAGPYLTHMPSDGGERPTQYRHMPMKARYAD